MTDSEFFEFIIVIMELVAFITYLSAGAVVLEVMYPKLIRLVKRIAVRIKLRKIKRRIMSGIRVQSG